MDPSMIKILSLFRDRDNQDPDLGSVDGKHLSTLSKIELMAEFEKRGLNADELCRIGGIEPQQENLCRLLHFQMEVGSGEATATCTPGPSGPKKKKTESTTLRTLEEKVADLQRQLVDKKTADEASEVERARKEVKDEAMKGDVANMEVLHERLIILENVARKANHDSKDKYTIILSRFHVNKSKPSFVAALVLKLLSSKEECLILDAEQKLKKIFDTNTSSAMQTPAWGTPYANVFPNLATPGPSSAFPGMQPTFPWSAPYQPFGPRGSSSSFSPRPRMRTPFSGRPQLCFRCRRPGHLIRDCPQNQ